VQLTDLEFLTSRAGAALLERLHGEDLRDSNILRLITVLRKDYTADQARAALELAQVRIKAVEKFGDAAHKLYFTREAWEQASHPLVSRYRARNTADSHVVDICCGIGADALAFAEHGAHVTGIDLDPMRVEMARVNSLVLGLHANFEGADARHYAIDAKTDLIYFDPGRRGSDGRRVYDVEAYEPPLSLIDGWGAKRIMVKVSPGVDLNQLAGYGGEVWFISVEGDLKEAVLNIEPQRTRPSLFGARMQTKKQELKAVLITDEDCLEWNGKVGAEDERLSQPRNYLIEPDSSLIRAGLVKDAAARFDAYQLDDSTAYLTADDAPESAWVKAWRVIDWMPFNLKRLRSYLRERNVGNVTVKKRGTAVTPEALIPQLKLKGDQARTLVLTRMNDAQIVMICDAMPEKQTRLSEK
jgi:SAM-dependent methyltransferase